MSPSKQKITRVERLQSIEENKLNALSVDLAIANAEVVRLQQMSIDIQSQIDTTTLPDNNHVVQSHLQSMLWLSHLEQKLQQVAESIGQAETARDEVMRRMIEQKVKVNGWEKLTDQMRTDFAMEQQAVESLEADDRYLNNPLTR
ncbi:MAG: hypothetical protein WBD20_12245 [Pirellulaceae bacterium]